MQILPSVLCRLGDTNPATSLATPVATSPYAGQRSMETQDCAGDMGLLDLVAIWLNPGEMWPDPGETWLDSGESKPDPGEAWPDPGAMCKPAIMASSASENVEW